MNLSKQGISRGDGRRFLTAPFVLAVVLLGGAAVLTGPVAKWLDFKGAKLALPVKAPLARLDADALAPFTILERDVLKPAIVEALGTEEFLSWTLKDTSLPPDHPLAYLSLFVTYYSGGEHVVPHTPDVCYLGSGYEPAQPHENREADVATLAPGSTTVPMRVCTFRQTAVFQQRKHTVVYTFNSNGRFVSTRTGVRLLINNPANTYAYFSKVEVSYPRATRAQAIEGAPKVLERILPVLIEHHWPDFEAAERAARGHTATGG